MNAMVPLSGPGILTAMAVSVVEVRCRGDKLARRFLSVDGVGLLSHPGTLACFSHHVTRW